MYLDSDAANFAVLLARVWVGIMIFAHGWRHVKAVRSGPGMANWFESLGVTPGPLHAWTVTLTEVFIPVILVLGFLTPLDYGGVCALMLVALVTNHRQNGFFLSSAKEGYEYVASIAVLSITLGTLGPGKWSLDHAFDLSFPFEPKKALIVTAAVGIGGAALFLLAFWRPPKKDQPAA
ncbi:MAG: putative oxidoreductase [Actinomycetota bacterium]|jgi:putative oxidoreductase|nr:putative oxidoreductase [Actinomycetota bacterium]